MMLAAHQSDERIAAVPRARRVMALTFLCAFLLQSGPSAAVSRLYDAPAGVTLRDGQPCFFAPWRDPEAGGEAQWIGISVMMLEPLNRAMAVWSADLKGERPSTSERCIPCGVPTQGQRAVVATATLSDPVRPYRVILRVGLPGSAYGGRFGAWFCFGRDSAGQPILTQWDDDALVCTAKPLATPRWRPPTHSPNPYG